MDVAFKGNEWLHHSNIYEVNIRQYTHEGTFAAFTKHLPRLKEMGVEVIWLMPITPISKKGIKGTMGSYYACSSYTKINPEFGDENDFATLVEQVHSLGMKIIIDWVANHTGREHEWMASHPEWFTRNEEGEYTERNGWDDVVDLNYENAAMREALMGAMQYWVSSFNIDGFRCDMAHLVPLDFWQAARKRLEPLGHLFWLAECEDVAYHNVFDISYAWEWMHTTEKMMKGDVGVHEIYNVLHSYAQYPKNSFKLFYTSNHDENSWNGTEYEKYHHCAKAMAVFSYTWKNSVPLVYSGQEMANTKRLLFFDKDALHWVTHPILASMYSTLNQLRKDSKAIALGEVFQLPMPNNYAMAFLRIYESEVVLVVLNFSQEQLKTTFSHEKIQGTFMQVFSGLSYQLQQDSSFDIMPGEYMVYRKIK